MVCNSDMLICHGRESSISKGVVGRRILRSRRPRVFRFVRGGGCPFRQVRVTGSLTVFCSSCIRCVFSRGRAPGLMRVGAGRAAYSHVDRVSRRANGDR